MKRYFSGGDIDEVTGLSPTLTHFGKFCNLGTGGDAAGACVVHAMHGLNTDSGNMGPPLPDASDIGKGQTLDKTKVLIGTPTDFA